MVTVLALGAAFFGGLSFTAETLATPGEPELALCPTPLYRSEEASVEDADGRWTYKYQLMWCAKEGRIDWIVGSAQRK